MKKTKKIISLLLVLILSSCQKIYDDNEKNDLLEIQNYKEVQEVTDIDEITISRLEVAKMISLTFMSEEEIEKADPLYIYEDVDYENKNTKYITGVSNIGMMAGDGISFRPYDKLTLEEAEYLLNSVNEKNEYSLYLDEENKNTYISYGLWVDLYYNTLISLKEDETLYNKFGVIEDDIIILETSKEDEKSIITKGSINNSTIDLTGYIDKKIKVLKKGNEILSVLKIVDEQPTINNALIVSNTSEEIKIFSGGAYREYKIINGLNEDYKGKICDITIDKNIATHVTIYTNEKVDIVKSYTDTYIEFQEEGIKPLNNNYQVYFNDDSNIEYKKYNELIVGSKVKYTINDEEKVLSAIITENYDTDIIRVAINTTNFNGLIHDNIDISATENFTVKFGDEELLFAQGENFIISNEEITNYMNDRIYIEPKNNGLLQINSIKRNHKESTPTYKGTLEIAYNDNGFTIINELTMDEYLYGVLPSEMPVSFGLEALKAQAITARSYAYNQIISNRFHKYGSHVDDSVSSQVYNNIEEQELSNQAVDETSGMYLAHNNNIISANFYSTSSGNTANSGEVWGNTAKQEFPTDTPDYLTSVKVYEGDYGDLSIEENADKFFRSTDIKSYDSFSSWFRWNVNMTKEELISSINKNINKRYVINNNMFDIKNNDGTEFEESEIILKDLKDIKIKSRGSGGLITEVELICSDKVITIKGEYNIRLLLSPNKNLENSRNIELYRKDDSVIENYQLLPSAFFTIDKKLINEELVDITFYGGGNGHGVGMSQNGAKGMADNGKNYEEILKYYYNNVEIINM